MYVFMIKANNVCDIYIYTVLALGWWINLNSTICTISEVFFGEQILLMRNKHKRLQLNLSI